MSTRTSLSSRIAVAFLFVFLLGIAFSSQAQQLDVFGRPVPSAVGNAAAASAASTALPATVTREPEVSSKYYWIMAPAQSAFMSAVRLQEKWSGRIQDIASRLGSRRDPSMWATLLALSFAYGVLHSLAPGHGKLVVGTYMGTHGGRARHALVLSIWTATIQAASAIVVVMGSILLTKAGAQSILTRAVSLELISYAMLCLAGGWTIWSIATRRDCCFAPGNVVLVPDERTSGPEEADQSYLGKRLAQARPARRQRARKAMFTTAATGWMQSQIFLTGLGAGMRPCAGAIFVLVASVGAHVPEAGIAATIAMALGVALTVTFVSLGASGFNRVASRWGSRYGARAQKMQRAAALLGGIVIVLFAALQIVLLLCGDLTPSLS